jgi:hypothetical protein
VVARDGKPIPVGRGLARGALLALAGPGRFGLPHGGLESLGMLSGSPAMMMALAFVVGALGFGLLFFYVLNTTTRQSLHDLAAGTYVVRYGLTPPLSARPPILRLALAYLLIIAIAGGVTLYSWPLVREKVAEYNRLATALSRIDGFLHLKTLEFKNDGIEVDVIWKPGQMAGPVERDVARTVIAQYPNLEPGKQLKISVGYGFGRMVKWFQSTSRQMRVEAWKKELGL